MASNRDGRALYLDLSKGRVNSPIYLIYGEETFLVDETIKMMVRAVLPNGVDNFSHEIFDGAETPGLAIRQALENLPLFGGQRLIMVRNIASIPVDETAALMPYFERPAPETTFLMTGRTVDFRKRFFKAVRKSKNVLAVEFKPLYANELSGWVERRARQKRLVGLTGELAELVVALTGPELNRMSSALDKLSLYISDANSRLDETLLRAILDDTRTRSVFELTRLLGEGNLNSSLNSAHRMISGGESAVAMVSMIARHFRIVWRVAEGAGNGLRGRDLARHAGCPPMFLGEYERDARRFSTDRLAGVIQTIHTGERRLKSSAIKDSLVVDALVMEICL